ncbi:MAG: FAD-dependent oxidoreductase [Planctomycetaceae bacterium]|nr:FAD-dependent oxidoreductase [Planctomycetaceae bacterium]
MQFQTESVWWATLNAAERQELGHFHSQTPYAQPDVLIIGGGIVGLAVGYFAAEKGWKVQVITAASRLAEDAEASLGSIFPNAVRWRLSPLAQQLAQNSRDWWARLAVRPDFQVDWRVSGAVLVEEQHLLPNPRTKMLEMLEDGYSVRDVDAEQIAILEPQLKPLSMGGLHFPSEAMLHPLKAAVGFVRGIRRLNGRIATNCPIQQIQRQNDQLTIADTAAGRIEPKLVVVDQFDELPNPLPETGSVPEEIESLQRRVFLATAPTSSILNRPVLCQEWLLQLKSGEVVAEACSDCLVKNPPEVDLVAAAQSACELLPALSAVPFIRTWSATSPQQANHVPNIDLLEGFSNAWCYRNLSNCEVLLAPMIGRLLTQWMGSEQRPEELTPFTRSDTPKNAD